MFPDNRKLRAVTTIATHLHNRATSLIAILCILPVIVTASVPSPETLPGQQLNFIQLSTVPGLLTAAADIKAGEELFTGRTRFQNSGPPCASYHGVATLPFPQGRNQGVRPHPRKLQARTGRKALCAPHAVFSGHECIVPEAPVD